MHAEPAGHRTAGIKLRSLCLLCCRWASSRRCWRRTALVAAAVAATGEHAAPATLGKAACTWQQGHQGAAAEGVAGQIRSRPVVALAAERSSPSKGRRTHSSPVLLRSCLCAAAAATAAAVAVATAAGEWHSSTAGQQGAACQPRSFSSVIAAAAAAAAPCLPFPDFLVQPPPFHPLQL